MPQDDPTKDVFSGDPANEEEPGTRASGSAGPEQGGEAGGGSGDLVPEELKEFVGEGKKFRSMADLAKGYTNAQQFIDKLQEENAELRGELKATETLESLLSSVRATPGKESGNRADHPNEAGENGEAITEERISQLVQDEVTRRERETTAAQNERNAAEKLAEMAGSGTEANRLVKEAAKDLGVSVDYLRSQAQVSPTAFLKMVAGNTGGDGTPRDTSESGSHNAEALAAGKRRFSGEHQPWSYWQDQRKKMRKSEYYSPEVQNRIMRSRQALGDAFYDA